MSAQLNGRPAAVPTTDARFHDLIAQAPLAISVLRGPDFVIETSNAAMLRIVGRGEEIIGKPTLESFPEIADQPVWSLMQRVYRTGEAVNMDEVAATLLQDGREVERFYNISYTPFQEEGKTVGMLQAVTDVTEQVRARRVAEESKVRFRAAVDAVQGILWTNDAAGKMVGEQPGWAALTGQSFEEYQGYGWVTAVHPDDAQPTVAAWEEAVRERKTFVFEHRVRRADSSWGLYSIRAIPLLDKDGAIREWVGVHTDITEQHRADEELKYRQALLEAQNEAIPDAILIVDTKGGMISFNRHFAEVWGIPAEIMVRKDDAAALEYAMTQLVDPQGFIEGVNYCYASPDEVHDHTEILFKDGRSIERWGNPVTGADGTHYGWAWYFRDVTERKKADEALRKSEQRFRSIFNGQFLFLAILAPDGRVLDINELPLQAGGARRENVVGKVFWDTVWWKDLPEMRANWPRRLEQAAAEDGPVFTEDRFQTASGEARIADAAVTAVRDSEGAVEFFIVQASDVTERKQAEKALRASEERYQTFVRQSSEGIWRFEMAEPVPIGLPLAQQLDLVFQHAYLAECNDAMAQMYGYEKAEELHGARISDFMPRDEESEAYLTLFITSGYRISAAESHEKDRDGADRYFMNNLLGIVEDGKIQRAWGTQRDITEQRAAEEALRKSEAEFRDFSNNIQNLAWIADADGYIFWYNQRWYDYTGTTLEEMQGWGWEKVHHPEHIGRVVDFVKEAWTRDKPFELTFPLRSKEGEDRWFLTRVEPVFDDSGKRIRWVGTNTDIHEQITAQRKVEESESLFSTVTNSSPTGLWLSDEDGGLTYLNETLTEWTGMPYESLLGAGWASAIIEDDRQRSAETFLSAVAERTHYDVLFRIRKGDGSIVWCRAAGDPYYREDGSYAGYAGFCMDIEEQMQGRKALEESEAQFRALIEEAPIATCLFVGRELRVELANDAMLALWDKGPDILNMPLAQALPELEGQPFLKILDDVFTSGEAFQATATAATIVRNGVPNIYYFDFTYKPLRNAEGDVYAILEMAMEVTEQVAARRAVEESEQNLRNIIMQAPVAMCILSGPEHVVTVANPRILRDHWQKTEEEVMGRPFFEVVPEAAGVGFEELLLGVMETGVTHADYAQPVPLPRNGGVETVYVNYVYEPFREADGRISGVMIVVAEVTEQVLATKKLQASEVRFRTIIEQTPSAIGLLGGRDMVVETANDTLLKFWGKSRAVTGLPLLEALPEIEEQGFIELLQGVYDSGEAFFADAMLAKLERGGVLEDAYFDLAYTPSRDEHGTVTGVIVLATEVTAQVTARKKIEESEAYFRRLTDTVPAIIWITQPDGYCTYLNQNWYDHTGQSREEAEGFGWLDATHPDDKEHTGKLFVDANAAHKPFHALYRLRHASGEYRWAIDSGQPKFAADGTYEGMIGTVVDVHEQQTAEEKVRVGERRFRSVIEAAPVAIGLFVGRDLVIESPNQTFIDIVGRGWDIIGKPLREVMPELVTEDQPFLKILDEIFNTGVGFDSPASQVKILRGGVMTENYYNITYQPLFDEEGNVYAILDVALDVTEQVMAQQRVEQSEENLRSLVESAPFPIGVYVGKEMRIQLANQAILDVWGKGRDVVGKLYSEILPELEGSGIYEQLDGVYTTGEPFHARQQRVDLEIGGVLKPHYFNYSFTPLYDGDGQVYGVMNTAAELTDLVTAKQQVEEAGVALRGAIELAELGTWEVDAMTGRGDCSERLQSWIGVEDGEDILAAFMQAVHPDDQARVASSLQRAIELYSNGDYDEEYRLVNRLTGRQRIIHAQGKAAANAEGVATRVSGTAQDVTKERALQAELERQVQERTAELADAARNLQRSNEELSQYAYVASHDLQEPLRKIRMFSGILDKQASFSEGARNTLGRISAAAERMAELIQSLLEFSRLQRTGDVMRRPVDLAEVVQDVTRDFELVVAEKGAVVEAQPLPVVEAVALQMNQLFYNLLGNALKFSKPGVAPVVRISSEPAPASVMAAHLGAAAASEQPYYHIRISDNGIGFEVKYAEQIFEVFKRLHARDAYPGSGIGLALCRRIVDNHGGALWAESEPGTGTTFNILLPRRPHDGGEFR